MEDEYRGKTAVVTGAARGIGEALARALWSRGVQVTAGDINTDNLKKLESECEGIRVQKCDVTVLKDCENLIQSALDRYGKLDYVISDAGILKSGALEEIKPEDWEAVIRVNLIGTFYMLRAAAPYEGAQARDVRDH